MKPIALLLILTITTPSLAGDLYAHDREPAEIDTRSFALHDKQRRKDLDLRVTWPDEPGRHPVLIFSHGATGSKDVYQPLAKFWAGHGYVVIQPTHLDSHEYGGRISDRSTLARAWKDRVDDVRFILDSLAEIDRRLPGDAARIDPERIAMAGHSYGAITSQMIGGMQYVLPGGRKIGFADDRVDCFVIISPQGTGKALTDESYREMTRPMLMITGDNDGTPFGDGQGEWRREAFDHAPPGKCWLMWIDEAHHSFGGIAGPIRYRGGGEADPKQVEWIQRMSLAFLDARFLGDENAATWLGESRLREATRGKAWVEHNAE